MSTPGAARRLIDDFENGIDETAARVIGASERYEHHAERLVREIFAACGFAVETGPHARRAAPERQIDFDFIVERGWSRENVVVEVKTSPKPLGRADVDAIVARSAALRFNRLLIVARNGFTNSARDAAETNGLGWLDLLDPASLRAWIAKAAPGADAPSSEGATLIRSGLRGIMNEVARRPGLLAELQWLDFERIVNPAKAKHWSLPGRTAGDRHFVKVAAQTNGTELAGIATFETRAILRNGATAQLGLARAYYRITSELWTPDGDAYEVLFET